MESQQRRFECREVRLALRDADADQAKCGKQPARARIRGELPQERPRIHRPVKQIGQRACGQEKQALALQIRRGIRAANRAEMHVVHRQDPLQLRRCRVRLFGNTPVDHGDDQVLELWERRPIRRVPLLPGKGRAEQQAHIGGHPKPRCRQPASQRGERHERRYHDPCMPGGDRDEA